MMTVRLIHCFVDECRGERGLSLSLLGRSGKELDSG